MEAVYSALVADLKVCVDTPTLISKVFVEYPTIVADAPDIGSVDLG